MTLPDEAIKQAKGQGYSNGYAAGKRRKMREIRAEQQYERESAFWQRAMLVALPMALTQSDWKTGVKPITSRGDRVHLAAGIADDVLDEAKRRARV